MKLYFAEVLNPRKTCSVAKYLKSPVEYVPVNLGRGEHKTPEFLAMNPNGKVRVLVDDGRVLTESGAIMCYLARPQGRLRAVTARRHSDSALNHSTINH